MTQIVKKLCLSPEGGELWSLSSDFMVVLNDGTQITVTEGYTSDGQSGNKIITALFTEYDSYQEEGAYVHDACYQSGLPKGWCDKVYREILSHRLTPDEVAKRFNAVDWFGQDAYNLDQKDIDKAHKASEHLRITLS